MADRPPGLPVPARSGRARASCGGSSRARRCCSIPAARPTSRSTRSAPGSGACSRPASTSPGSTPPSSPSTRSTGRPSAGTSRTWCAGSPRRASWRSGPGTKRSPPVTGGPERRGPSRARLAISLLGVDLGLRLLGFGRLRALLARRARPDGGAPRAPDEAELAAARRLARQVERAAGLRIYRVPCLARALLLERLLARRGLPATLRIGVRRPGAGRLGAHAWVECGGLVLDPDPRVAERFRPLA